jgi:hypothetical protein
MLLDILLILVDIAIYEILFNLNTCYAVVPDVPTMPDFANISTSQTFHMKPAAPEPCSVSRSPVRVPPRRKCPDRGQAGGA